MSERLAPVVPPFDEWVAARSTALLRFAYLLTGSQSEAEDAVQSALERALARWQRVARTEDPETYVRRMIVNEHISLWRRWRRRVSPVAVVRETVGGQADLAETVASADVVRRLCAALPATQRAAVVLRYYQDLDYREIAALLGCAEATARSHVHRALQALRHELAGEDDDA
ncbi:SigE family RNA polymerase sigma factor [Nocardioides sp. BP30]|uniref:SigE family RNA polymerase sigma factor n=1 Tax=Nocardioides sp. BP30 TaxID=3036374 RepID=UPI0024689C3B|nr:SigE family RNA polymerase sigma factor [Nocardioides sp. BP30]WGL51221.1 SigE family RNA polymerase sigma factor [Nocardioides sp. BP30]